MATVNSTKTCLPKLACSALVVGLFTARVFITGAYPHKYLNDRLFDLGGCNQTNSTTSEHTTNQPPNETNSSAQWEVMHANNQALQEQLEQALDRIEQNVQKNKELAEQISRSPRAIQTIQALEAAIAIFGQNKHEPEYEVSEYATGNRCWKCSPAVHPVPIQDLLLYGVKHKHNQNKILGDKVAQVVQQNTHLHKRFPVLMRHLRRSSRRSPSWDWSPRPWPIICSSDITMDKSGTTTQGQRTSPHGGNHFSKRRSESEN